MKKLVSLLLSALMLLGMASAALAEAAPETVTITSLNANREPVELGSALRPAAHCHTRHAFSGHPRPPRARRPRGRLGDDGA